VLFTRNSQRWTAVRFHLIDAGKLPHASRKCGEACEPQRVDGEAESPVYLRGAERLFTAATSSAGSTGLLMCV
jgi:hypothetical protein